MSPTRMFLSSIVVVALAVSASGCAQQPTEKAPGAAAEAKTASFKRMTIEELSAKMAEAKAGKLTLRIFDNNQKERYESGHIPSATWVKFDDIKASDLPADKEATLVFYCANEQCSACHHGAEGAVALGYKNVYILPAGIKGWEAAQKLVERS